MNYLYETLPENLLYALGWTVVHSIWQGILIAVILAFALLLMEKKTARARYAVANFGLIALLLTSVVTFLLLYQKAPAMSLDEAFLIEVNGVSEASFWQNFTNYFNQNLPLIVSVWLMGVVFFILKMLGGLIYIQQLKNRHNHPLSDFWQQKMNAIGQKIPLQQSVELLESALVKVPMVVGYLKPVILLPIGAINALSEDQVEAILAHELAHIYRNDYLLNILQTFVETLFYFHPAVWWISGNIRLERENCCDDLAVKLCGNPLSYARALVSLQEMHAEAPALAMAFSSPKNQLLNRVQRILNQPQNKSNIMEKLMATTLFVVLMIMISFGANTPMANILTGRHFSENIEIGVNELSDLEVVETADGKTIIVTYISQDTIPNKSESRSTISKTSDGVASKIALVDGEIEELVIDGKTIAKKDFGKYKKEIKDLRSSMRNVPAPPAPPSPPAPPTPGAISTPPPPMAVPAPPIPPSPEGGNSYNFNSFHQPKTIITEKDGAGNTVITIEERKGEKPTEIKIEETKDGKQLIIINGKKMESLGENDRYILEETKPYAFYFDQENSRFFELGEYAPRADFSEYFVFENGQAKEDLLENFDFHVTPKSDFPATLFEVEKGNAFPFFEDKTPENLEYRRWKERFEVEKAERQKDGNLSQEWLIQKQAEEQEWVKKNRMEAAEQWTTNQAETAEQYQKQLLELSKIRDFTFPEAERNYQLLEFSQLEKLNGDNLFKELQDELILDGLIQKDDIFYFELNEEEFKINGQKQSQKQLKKYQKLLKKQQRQRLKFQSKLS